MENLETTIVAFHIGRGGRFNNSGFLSFKGEERIGKFMDHLFDRFENVEKFNNRFGFDSTNDENQKCILDLIGEEDFEQLEEKFGISKEMLGEIIYFEGASGRSTGLTQSEVESGVGRINIDEDYDTTYTCFLKDCDENEIDAIKNSTYWNKEELLDLLSVKSNK